MSEVVWVVDWVFLCDGRLDDHAYPLTKDTDNKDSACGWRNGEDDLTVYVLRKPPCLVAFQASVQSGTFHCSKNPRNSNQPRLALPPASMRYSSVQVVDRAPHRRSF